MRGDEASRARAQRGRSTGQAADPALDAHLARQIDRLLKQALGEPARLRERVEVLVGERGKGQAATVEQLRALLQGVPAQPTSRVVNAAPTQAQHNAVVADVARLYEAFNALRVLLQ